LRYPRNLPVLAVAASAPSELSSTVGPSIPQHFANPGLSLFQVLSIVKAYRKHAIIIGLIVVAISAVFIKILPKTFTATATLMVNNQSRDPLEGIQSQQQPLGPFMATEIQLMQSAEVLLPVIDQLKLTQDKNYTAGYRGDGSTLREWVKEDLIKDLDVEPGSAGSQLIYVTASARYPQLSAQIANAVADVYLTQERDRVSGPASDRAKRYAAELAELKDKVRVAQDQVTAFRQRTGVPDAPTGSVSIDSSLLASLEARLQEAQNARRAAEVKAATDPGVSNDPLKSVTINALKAQIASEQAQLAEMSATLGARHPKVLQLESQLAANRHNLANEVQNLSAGASADLVAARQLEAKLQAAVTQQRDKVLSVSRMKDEGTKYELELESTQSVYKRALDGYDQIMFASDGHLANVNMVSRAVPPQKASKPSKIKLLLVGVFAGLMLGLTMPIVYELLINRRVRCRDDFERDFAVPVLIEFDPIPAAGGAA
jgi:succinoglycan biosynthesis transport protein ExoP